MEKYEVLGKIGKGGFGQISKIRHKKDGKILVCKEIDYTKFKEKEKRQMINEVNILRDLKSQFIVRYFDSILEKEKNRLYIIMEYCDGGDLSQVIKRTKKSNEHIPEEMIWKILSQL